MKIPKTALIFVMKPIKKMLLQAYREGKKHTETGIYDENAFNREISTQIKKEFT